MAIIPTTIPITTLGMALIPKASGIKSKHITAIINPEANASIKLKNLLETYPFSFYFSLLGTFLFYSKNTSNINFHLIFEVFSIS